MALTTLPIVIGRTPGWTNPHTFNFVIEIGSSFVRLVGIKIKDFVGLNTLRDFLQRINFRKGRVLSISATVRKPDVIS